MGYKKPALSQWDALEEALAEAEALRIENEYLRHELDWKSDEEAEALEILQQYERKGHKRKKWPLHLKKRKFKRTSSRGSGVYPTASTGSNYVPGWSQSY